MKRFIYITVAVALCACGTVARKEVRHTQASHTSTGQDSGVMKDTTPDKGGVPVNQEWIDGYDALLERYGNTLIPPRKKGDRNGITKEGDHYRINDAVWERQLVLNQRASDNAR